ncbi:hypothetical protein EZ449_03485 [Pedobacter frigidisoli]|uniref:Uncharacterized protein n=1 Tax=Pedobacter frigidisoli TaxID=2530455 RepID=A0A4R0P5E1_9SPHI|nr:hypothetical protein [Pedobacter frigidisoli]TCD12092.1 hypothetical protein EZ449_03485 [Pedobacter frigidisoli]
MKKIAIITAIACVSLTTEINAQTVTPQKEKKTTTATKNTTVVKKKVAAEKPVAKKVYKNVGRTGRGGG